MLDPRNNLDLSDLDLTGNGWTVDREKAAIRLWNAGASYMEIAARLCGGLTRSSVAGKISRLAGKGIVRRRGLDPAFRKSEKVRVSAPKPRPVQAARVRRLAVVERRSVFDVATDAGLGTHPILDTSSPPLADMNPVPFLERRQNQCPYPLWSDAERTGDVCGREMADGQWFCAEHSARCLIPAKRIPRWRG